MPQKSQKAPEKPSSSSPRPKNSINSITSKKKKPPQGQRDPSTHNSIPSSRNFSALADSQRKTQQAILDTFSRALSPRFRDLESLRVLIQEIKGHLYSRDFAAAFGREEYLEAYAARWSPSRALGYVELVLGESELGIWLVESGIPRGYGATVGTEGEDARESMPEHVVIERGLKNLDLGDEGSDVGGRLSDRDAQPYGPRDTGEISRGVDATITPGRYEATTAASDQLSEAILLHREVVISSVQRSRRKVACLGGGAGAELVAFAAMVKSLQNTSGRPLNIHLDILDSAPWASVLNLLHQALPTSSSSVQVPGTTSPPSDESLNDIQPGQESLTYTFTQVDLLSASFISSSDGELHKRLGDADLVTLFFTLNELYASSRASATALLLALGDVVKARARLIVVDSAGSYAGVGLGIRADGGSKGKPTVEEQRLNGNVAPSEISKVGERKAEKRYPMQWLLDHTLLELAREENDAGIKSKGKRKWEKILGEDSRWFRRRSEDLEHQVPLEDMRFQVHLYERN